MPAQRSRQDLEPRASEHDQRPPERGVPVDGTIIAVFVVIAAVGVHLTGVISPGAH